MKRPALDFGTRYAEAMKTAGDRVVSESGDGRTTLRCTACGEKSVYPCRFSKGPRGSLRLQACPNCKALYFKPGEVVA